MKILQPVNKAEYLEKNYPFYPVPQLTDKKICLHCGEEITVGDFKVEVSKGEQFIVCPNAPKCGGNITDWVHLDYRRKN
jgi:hypothetical protein